MGEYPYFSIEPLSAPLSVTVISSMSIALARKYKEKSQPLAIFKIMSKATLSYRND